MKARLLAAAALLLLLACACLDYRGAPPIVWAPHMRGRRLAEEDVLAAAQCANSTVDELTSCLNSYRNKTDAAQLVAAAVPVSRGEVVLGSAAAAGWGGYTILRGLVPPGGSVPTSNGAYSKQEPSVELCASTCMSNLLCNCFLFCPEQASTFKPGRCRAGSSWCCCWQHCPAAGLRGVMGLLLLPAGSHAHAPHTHAGRLPCQ